jgi:fructose 1,6-bisphosphatase
MGYPYVHALVCVETGWRILSLIGTCSRVVVGSLYEREAEGVVPFSIERKKRTVSRYDQTSSS